MFKDSSKVIFSSASKIVFIILAVTACIALFVKAISAEQWMSLAIGAFSYYFGRSKKESMAVKPDIQE